MTNPLQKKFLIGMTLETDEPRAYDATMDTAFPWEDIDVRDEVVSWLEDLGFKVNISVEEI
jgi:hypothetical protein